MKKFIFCAIVIVAMSSILLSGVMPAHAAKYKVLVVLSYEEDYLWCQEIKQAVDSVLADSSEIRYFYMDTKKNPDGGPQKAQEAYALYQEFQPDGVITADDNAQSMFVVPFLKDKVKTPVMFAGVNADPAKYGFPASNVSGILERDPIRETLVLAKQLVPTLTNFVALLPDNTTGQALELQMETDKAEYPIAYAGKKVPKTVDELMAMVEELKQTSDTVMYFTFAGMPNAQGEAMADKDLIPMVIEKYGKPVLTQGVIYGGLCAIVKTGNEQGDVAARMLLEAMQGKPVSEIPITQNQFGRRVINVETLKKLGITPSPDVLRGAELVKTTMQ
ncbi:ABC-type uncharacterized transport system periplasmic component-like protein [Candidatus Moduliflexus flocculans]|uniref:ABC-type uncharacterized transport system periplasmic component-like protein n=1 Tax=Candidatus Moduliflexus flocculans TaxID=1499966 RepID=A0A0S6VYM3_9BACT|nr:ABC-type uncharacterized transport system periplasmic component-like protein [Candidatus Moduliflexus flocculans]